MILSDREIRAAIQRKAISLDPLPSEEAWTSMAVDLHLGSTIQTWNVVSGQGVSMEFRPADADFHFPTVSDRFTTKIELSADGYSMQPRSFVLAWTVDKLKLPQSSRISARVEGKSSLARLGMGVHVTAPTIHAGFGFRRDDVNFPGTPLQLEIWHVGPLPIRLVTGMPICQLIFEEVHGTPDKGYSGIFATQG